MNKLSVTMAEPDQPSGAWSFARVFRIVWATCCWLSIVTLSLLMIMLEVGRNR
jgi:hypothetical protein